MFVLVGTSDNNSALAQIMVWHRRVDKPLPETVIPQVTDASPVLIESENISYLTLALQWRHNERDGVSNHQLHHCLLNRLFKRLSKKTSKLRVTGFCVGNSPVTGEFPEQMASNAENVSIWWRHHVRTSTQSGFVIEYPKRILRCQTLLV